MLLLFCDLSTSKSSLESLEYWLREGKDNGAGLVVIVGSKSDMKKINDMDKIAKDKGLMYFETSAKSGDGIN